MAEVFHAGHLMVSPLQQPALPLTAALLKPGLWAVSRPSAFYSSQPWRSDVLPVATEHGEPTHLLHHARTPSTTCA